MQQSIPAPIAKDPAYRWVVVSLCHLGNVSSQMVMVTIGILLPAITADLSLSPGQQGLLGSVSYWAPVLLAIPLGWAGSRMSPKWLTLATLVVGTLCLFMQSWAPAFGVLLAGRLLFGVTNIAQQPARALLTRQWFRLQEIVLVNGLSNVFFGVIVGGGLALAPIILSLADNDWRTTLRVLGLYYGAISLAWLVLGRDRAIQERSSSDSLGVKAVLRSALRHRDLWICATCFCGATMSFGSFLAFYPTLMLNEYDVSLKMSGGVLAVDVIVGGIAGMGVGYAAAATKMEGRFLQVLGVLMIGSAVGMIQIDWLPAIFFFGTLNGLAWAFFPILITVPFNLRGIQPRELAVAFSFTMMFVSFGIGAGPLITGYLQELTGDLKLALFVMCFIPVTLIVAGATLSFGRGPAASPATEAAPGD